MKPICFIVCNCQGNGNSGNVQIMPRNREGGLIMETKVGKTTKYLVGLVILAGFFLTYWFRPQEDLPILDQAQVFELETTVGEKYQSNNGKVKLLAFFYTNCPDICPLTMQDFNRLQTKLQEEGVFGNKVELLAITLDPEKDTLPVIKEYASIFEADHTGWKFLRGSTAEIEEIADDYHMKFKKVEGDFIAHNTTMFLIDKNNNIRGLYDMANSEKSIEKEEILSSMLELVKEK